VSQNSLVLLIPARYQSQRLPGKPLAMLAGESLISRVAKKALECQKLCEKAQLKMEMAVVTDDQRIADHVTQAGFKAVRVDDDVPSGSERIFLAYQRFYKDQKVDLILNMQGDEPLLNGSSLFQLIRTHLARPEFEIMTLVHPKLKTHPDFLDPNRVKAVYSAETKECHYFSRASLPFERDGASEKALWYQHVGVYSYRPQALAAFCQATPTLLETQEKLEQLRAIELGFRIGAEEIDYESMGVDTPEDIHKVEGVLRG